MGATDHDVGGTIHAVDSIDWVMGILSTCIALNPIVHYSLAN